MLGQCQEEAQWNSGQTNTKLELIFTKLKNKNKCVHVMQQETHVHHLCF